MLTFPIAVNPTLTINDAQNILHDDPFGSILICFFTAEIATEQLLSSHFELPRIKSHTYMARKLTEISSELGTQFTFISELRNKIVFGLLNPNIKLAANYIEVTRNYLKLLDEFLLMNKNKESVKND